MGRGCGQHQQRNIARSILAFVALYALVAQTLLASAIPAFAASVAPGLPQAVLCAHDPTQAADPPPAGHAGHGLHASCCTAACPFAGALPPPEPAATALAPARGFAAIAWQHQSGPDRGGRASSPFSARGPPG
ncbi:hypothetical protein [Chelatococcus reniformis]|uniref:DUF2946 domain-containing protein n=1 Tax=Chelatococcus reniformis TaxID=1494448 RepID=A0A916XMY4_9HYPH|nr:hypothetical protein [Chelatococcus reniformis]GGC88310.1 hypothetical protein GCM10010994_52850 [Chelatococcus reniformis]